MKARLPVASIALALAGCATASPSCPAGTAAMTRYELFFGGGPGAGDWQAFLDSEITPRFPGGLTVLDAYGQWRGASGQIAREQTKELVLIAANTPDVESKIAVIRNAYKQRFRQESVLLVQMPVCAGF